MSSSGIDCAHVLIMMPYSKLQNTQGERSEVGAANPMQKLPQLRNQNIESGAETDSSSSGIIALVHYRVHSQLANIDVLRSTRGQAHQVAALLKHAGFRDVQIEEIRV